MDAGDWFSAGAVFVAVLAFAFSIRANRQSIAAQEKSADADDRIATLEEARAGAEERRPPWVLEPHHKARYRLTNAGDAVAHRVSISFGDRILATERAWESIGPRSAEEFTAQRASRSGDANVTVVWYRPGDEKPRTWTHPLPPQQR